MAQINIDYDLLDEEGNNILDLCNNYDDFINKSVKLLENLKENWQTEASETYQERLNNMINIVYKDKYMLERFGNLIIRVRREFKETEDTFCSEFKSDFGESIANMEGVSYYE